MQALFNFQVTIIDRIYQRRSEENGTPWGLWAGGDCEDREKSSDQRCIWKELEDRVAGEGFLGGEYVGKQGYQVRLFNL